MIHRVWRRFRPKRVPQKGSLVTTNNVESLYQSLLEQTPGAVEAQREMDKHPGGYHTDKVRLYELIDFNDSFVSLALSLSPEKRAGFINRLKADMAAKCKQVGVPMFSDEQFEAITRGLSREVAVYLGAKSQGFGVKMTSRTQDAMGVDMLVTDPVSGKSVGIDCKTASSYRHRIQDLVGQGRLSYEEARAAEERGFTYEVNGRGSEAVAVILFRVDANELGDIVDFTFKEPALLAQRLRQLFSPV